MDPNPYRSPIIPPPGTSGNDGPDGAVRILTEIRDNQREMLAIYRRTALTQRLVLIGALAILVMVGVIGLALIAVANFIVLPNS